MNGRRVRELAKQAAVSVMSLGGAYPVRATATSDVAALIRRLYPRKPDAELIRLGPAADGGYLVPDDLQGIEACFSPGVGEIVGFERACAARGMLVFMADGSVDAPALAGPTCAFLRKFIGAVNSADSVTMDEWVRSVLPETRTDLLLQIDIEGSEYETFLGISDGLMRRFRIITGEFHFLDQLWNRPYFGLVSRAFERILQSHTCVHIHPNNCTSPVTRNGITIPPVMEFTFVRNDRISGERFVLQFPHPLDSDNTAGRSVSLPSCWHSAG